MFKKAFIIGSSLASLVIPAAAQAQHYGNRDQSYYRDSSHYYYDGHHYRDRGNNAVIDTIIGGLIGYGLGAATSGGYNNSYGYAQPGYGYGYSQPAYSYAQPGYAYAQPSYGYGYAQPAYGYSQVLVIPGYTYRDGYYWDNYGRRYDRDSMYRRYGRR